MNFSMYLQSLCVTMILYRILTTHSKTRKPFGFRVFFFAVWTISAPIYSAPYLHPNQKMV